MIYFFRKKGRKKKIELRQCIIRPLVFIMNNQGRNWWLGRVGNCPTDFGRIEVAAGQQRSAALLPAHQAFGSQLRP
jgi:hypothetical protein